MGQERGQPVQVMEERIVSTRPFYHEAVYETGRVFIFTRQAIIGQIGTVLFGQARPETG